ncbi:MAG: GTP 3',8-cyclase MoaA [Enterobacteriaceae bacterium]
MDSQLIDLYQRKFYYLRLSITDVCNFRCSYCLPDGYQHQGRKSFLSVDEIGRVARVFATLGTEKVRLTGGEPTLRRDFLDIVSAIRQHSAITTLAVTTNGYRMQRDVQSWRDAGITAINVSIDSLDPRQFQQITGESRLHQVLAGIDAAFSAGYQKLKVNTVLLRGMNDLSLDAFLHWIKNRPIQMRFIELMETGEGREFFRQYHYSGTHIRDRLLAEGWQRRDKGRSDGPAQVFHHPDYLGEIGLIMPYEQNFCQSCNRLRISSVGKLHLCLFGEAGVSLRDLLQEEAQLPELQARIRQALTSKRETHYLHQGDSGITPNLAFIGG